ncbi:MAG: hypothetical protein ABFD92_16275 [Planctomycetaceae bacterium]|nr:hypothetical protein [Planctomycetaceae bacterium]
MATREAGRHGDRDRDGECGIDGIMGIKRIRNRDRDGECGIDGIMGIKRIKNRDGDGECGIDGILGIKRIRNRRNGIGGEGGIETIWWWVRRA